MTDINIKYNDLSSLIDKLEVDNKDIVDTIKKINDSIRSLDDTKWVSNEKSKLDAVLLPYITQLDNNLLSYLNESVDTLKTAYNKYQESEKIISDNSQNLG